MTSTPVMELERGSVILGRTEVLREVDFNLGPGELVVLLGGNGSGKSTLVRALLGLVPLSDGRARLYGKELKDFKRWNTIGYVPQRVTAASGVPATAGEVVLSGRAAKAGPWRRYNDDDRAAAGRALELVDLSDALEQPVSTLSGGQQQRVLIARALAAEPDVLVLDEPVASIDLAHQESFAATLEVLEGRGTTILMVAHSLGAMERLVRRAVVLEGGKVVHDGPPLGHGHTLGHGHHPHPARRGA